MITLNLIIVKCNDVHTVPYDARKLFILIVVYLTDIIIALCVIQFIRL